MLFTVWCCRRGILRFFYSNLCLCCVQFSLVTYKLNFECDLMQLAGRTIITFFIGWCLALWFLIQWALINSFHFQYIFFDSESIYSFIWYILFGVAGYLGCEGVISSSSIFLWFDLHGFFILGLIWLLLIVTLKGIVYYYFQGFKWLFFCVNFYSWSFCV